MRFLKATEYWHVGSEDSVTILIQNWKHTLILGRCTTQMWTMSPIFRKYMFPPSSGFSSNTLAGYTSETSATLATSTRCKDQNHHHHWTTVKAKTSEHTYLFFLSSFFTLSFVSFIICIMFRFCIRNWHQRSFCGSSVYEWRPGSPVSRIFVIDLDRSLWPDDRSRSAKGRGNIRRSSCSYERALSLETEVRRVGDWCGMAATWELVVRQSSSKDVNMEAKEATALEAVTRRNPANI
jgi:hypothetical protein